MKCEAESLEQIIWGKIITCPITPYIVQFWAEAKDFSEDFSLREDFNSFSSSNIKQRPSKWFDVKWCFREKLTDLKFFEVVIMGTVVTTGREPMSTTHNPSNQYLLLKSFSLLFYLEPPCVFLSTQNVLLMIQIAKKAFC